MNRKASAFWWVLFVTQIHDWVYDTISQVAKNGYYIASEKDEKCIGIRQETKQVRRMETIVDMHLETLMKVNLPYKEVYGGVKNLYRAFDISPIRRAYFYSGF